MKRLDEIIQHHIANGGSGQALEDTSGNIVSYPELAAAVTKYAEELKALLPVGQKSIIAVISERTIQLPALLYAVLSTGSAYVPIDHRFPAERVFAILDEAKPNAAIVENKYLNFFTEVSGPVFRSVPMGEAHSLLLFDRAPVAVPADTVYILYTSGSTGMPKGVIHTHGSVHSFLQWCSDAIPCVQGSKFISISPLQFDLSVFDLYFFLFRAGTLLFVAESELANHRMLAKIIADHKVNCIYATPSFFQLLCGGGKLHQYDYAHVSHLLLAGEQLYWALLHDMKQYFANSVFYNLYGPTETNVCCYYEAKLEEETLNPVTVPIGKPCGATKIHLEVYDDPQMPELWIASGTVMYGYVAAVASFREVDGIKYYNTGDLVKLGAGDNLVFCGRRDRMIKKNGFRIEPAEIERYIKELEGISQAVAVAIHIKNTVKLVIFIQSAKAYSLLDIKQYCLRKLPYYMVPDDVVIADELPVNLNNKTDIQQLIKNYVT